MAHCIALQFFKHALSFRPNYDRFATLNVPVQSTPLPVMSVRA